MLALYSSLVRDGQRSLLTPATACSTLVPEQDHFRSRRRKWVFKQAGRPSAVATLAEHDREDLLYDLSSIVYSMCARLYGQRRAKRTTEKIVQELEAPDAVS